MNKSVDLFELSHCDVWGPYRVPSSRGVMYFLTIVDDFCCGVWVYLMSEKSEVTHTIKEFYSMIIAQFGKG